MMVTCFKWSTVVGWSLATHWIIGALRCVCVSPLGGIRFRTAWGRIRESLHTMLLTISKSQPVSAGWLLLTVLCSYPKTSINHHHIHQSSSPQHTHTYEEHLQQSSSVKVQDKKIKLKTKWKDKVKKLIKMSRTSSYDKRLWGDC